MAPPMVNWKRLIDNGNSADGISANATELPVKMLHTVDEDPLKQTTQLPASPPGGGLGSDLLPVYCGVLCCLIIGLVAWIVFKQLRRRASHEDKLLPDQQQQPQQLQHLRPLADELEGSRQFHQHHHRHHREDQKRGQFRHPLVSQKRQSSDSGFYGSETAAGAATVEVPAVGGAVGADIRRCLLRDLSESRLQRLENILANDPDPEGWRRLASELGLSTEDLAKLDSQSARGNQSAIRLMLKTWAARDSSSVGQLVRCLHRVGRVDALILFREPSLLAGTKRAQRKMRRQQPQPQQQHQQEQQNQEVKDQQQQADTGDISVSAVAAVADATPADVSQSSVIA